MRSRPGRACLLVAAVCVPFVVLACGEDVTAVGDGMPTSVTIDPSELSLRIGEARTVEARYLDGSGGATEAPADWTSAWSSSDTTVATVDADGVVRARRPGSAEITLTTGAAGAALDDEALVQVLEPLGQQAADRTSGATVGPEGGSVAAEAGDGTRYVLTVPAGALDEPVAIELTPLTGIDNLPLTGPLAGAVDFSPDGLVFLTPAELRVIAPRPVELAGLAGFALHDGDFRLAPFQALGDTLRLMVGHFSGAGASWGEEDEVAGLASVPGGTPEDVAMQEIARHNWEAAMAGEDPDAGVLAGILETWYEEGLVPALEEAAKDPKKLEAAVAQFNRWGSNRSFWADGWLEDETMAARDLVADAISAHIERLNASCSTQNDTGPVAEILAWSARAVSLGLATPENGLGVDDVVENLCLQVRILETTFPDTIGRFATETLELRAGVVIGDRAPSFDTELEVTLDHGGTASVGPSHGVTNPDGHFSAEVSLVQESSRVRIEVEVAYPGIPQVSAVQEVSAWGEVQLFMDVRPEGSSGVGSDEVDLDPGGVGVLTITALQGRGAYLGRPITLSVDGDGTVDKAELHVDQTQGQATARYTAPGGTGEDIVRATLIDGGKTLRDSVIVRYEPFEPVDLELDFGNGEPNPTVTGPLLKSGVDYLVTVSGTYSIWTAEWQDGICQGAPDAGAGGPTGYDAEALFAVPVGSSLCGRDFPDGRRHNNQFRLSLNGDDVFDHYHPGGPPNYAPGAELEFYDASRTYTFRITGQGHPVQFRIEESGARQDDYGLIEIRVERAPPLQDG